MSHASPLRLRSLFSDESQLPVAIATGAALVTGFILAQMPAAALETTGVVLIWISLGLGGIHGVRAAIESLRELRPDIDVLMVVGAALAAGIGHPAEGALLLFMFTLAGALEHRALARTKDAVARLHKLMPNEALVRRGGDWTEIDPEQLAPGDVVLVRPGETVPADGHVTRGATAIDQSTLTGESMPRSVQVGDDVFAGTVNRDGAIEVAVTRPVTESSLQRILDLVLEAQETRQPIQRLIDRFSTPYTISVFVVTLAVFVAYLTVGITEGPLPLTQAAYLAITLLVVASPCALVISTPTATLCGLSRAARAGVLIKGGEVLENLASIRQVALDKTGTLTSGQIEVTHVEPVAASHVDSLLSIALAAEQQSTHPIAAAIVRLARSYDLEPAELVSMTQVPGRGLEGTYNGNTVRIGNYDFCAPIIPVCFQRHTQRMVEHIAADGGKAIVLAHGGQALVLALADTPREGAEILSRDLRQAGVSKVAMLTGDARVVADHLARQLGIEDVHAELLPEQKVAEIEKIRGDALDEGGIAVVGDGVNDAPALAVADVGLAMGGIGADAALETADVVLLHDDLNRIPWSFGLARRVKRVMRTNLAFATGVIVVLGVFTVIGKVPMWLGVLGHEGSTLLVVANSLRLLTHPIPPSTVKSPR